MSNYITPPETYSTSTSQSSSSPPDDAYGMKNFQFNNECHLELHASPFLYSALSLRIPNSDYTGIGTLIPPLTMSIPLGKLYYNDADDFADDEKDIRFKMHMYIDPNDRMLRIDLNKNFSDQFENNDFGHLESPNVFPSHIGADFEKVQEHLAKTSDVPDIVFKGLVPDGYPKELKEHLFGILRFQNIKKIPKSAPLV